MNKKSYVITIALSCFILALAISVQIKTVNSQNLRTISNDRETNELRTSLLKEQEKYEQYEQLVQKAQEQLDSLKENITKSDEQLKTLNEEVNNLNDIAGFNSVTGPGVVITLSDSKVSTSTYFGDQKLLLVHYTDIIMIINELKNAGAQAISVNGQRIVDSSSINCSGNIITINNKKVGSPFEIKAIGNSKQLLNITRPNGYIQILKDDKLEVTVKEEQSITIDKYAGTIDYNLVKKDD